VPAYRSLGIIESPWMKDNNWYLGPTTLNPSDPGSVALVRDLFAQQFPLCSSPYANVGGDEPWELGIGKSTGLCRERGRACVFGDYMTQVVAACERSGKRAQYWCDPHPNDDGTLPTDLVALVWEYDEPNGFAERLAGHAEAGREVWVAPGTSTWSSLTSCTWNRRANLRRAAREGLGHGARGYLVTDWGDCGNREQWPVRLFALLEGASAAWARR
jgi:hexosaminidase